MPPLNNARHEAFCRALFEGQPQNAAYEAAGYRYHEGNASRLRSNEKVLARLIELQAAAQKTSEVSVASLLSELEDAREKATTKDQLSAAVRAIEAKAKVSGLLTQKIEITNPLEEMDKAETPEQIAAALARGIAADRHYQLTAEETAGFAKLLVQWVASINEYLSGCAAKPVQQVMSAEDLQNIERRRLGLRQIGNGSKR